MKHYISFTSILHALSRNELSFDELDAPDALLCLGCAREHVLGNYVPQEVSWLKGNKGQYNEDGNGCDISKLTPESLILWNRFRMTLERADAQGRVHYRIGNYPAYVQHCNKQGTPVWWQSWREPEPEGTFN